MTAQTVNGHDAAVTLRERIRSLAANGAGRDTIVLVTSCSPAATGMRDVGGFVDAVLAETADPTALYPLLTIDALAALPRPSYLLEGFVRANAFNVLYGPSGVGKSLLGLDWALCIATGLAWYGQEATPGQVVYIAAEGVAGLYPRIGAWQNARRQPAVDRIRFIPEATNLLDERDVARVQRTLAQLDTPPALIVWDTMARSMVGGDENAARDVGMAIAAADKIAEPFQAARLFVHHTGKNGGDERGSSALRGASDLMLALKPHDAGLKLTCEKTKDAEPFEPWHLHLAPTDESCLIAVGTVPTATTPVELEILEAVSAAFGTDYASATAIREASGAAKSSLYRALNRLVESGMLAKDTSSSYPRFRLTPDGLAATVPNRPSVSHGTPQNRPVPPPSLRGGTWDATDPEQHEQEAER